MEAEELKKNLVKCPNFRLCAGSQQLALSTGKGRSTGGGGGEGGGGAASGEGKGCGRIISGQILFRIKSSAKPLFLFYHTFSS